MGLAGERDLKADLARLSPAIPHAPVHARPSSISSALAILRLLSVPGQEMGVNRIARELSIAPSSCFKILKQLQAENYVDFDDVSKSYSLGNNAINIGRQALDPMQAFTLIRPRLERAAQEFSMALGFWRVVPGARMVLAGFVEGDSRIRIHMPVGQRLPMYMGAVGRAIAAKLDLSQKELQREFSLLRWSEPLSFGAYAAQVDAARRQGYALDHGNFAPGVSTVAVAITDTAGTVRYGISGVMFSGLHTDDGIEAIAAELMHIAGWASERLVDCRNGEDRDGRK